MGNFWSAPETVAQPSTSSLMARHWTRITSTWRRACWGGHNGRKKKHGVFWMVLMYGLKGSWISLNAGWLKVGWRFVEGWLIFSDTFSQLRPKWLVRGWCGHFWPTENGKACEVILCCFLPRIVGTKLKTQKHWDWLEQKWIESYETYFKKKKNMFGLGIIFQTGCGTGKKSFYHPIFSKFGSTLYLQHPSLT